MSRIAEIDLSTAKGAQVCSRIHWAEEGETSTRYFFRLEKKRGAENGIPATENSNGSFASSIVEICDSWVSFYSSLFTACDTDLVVQGTLLDQLSSSLPPDQAGSCDGYISSAEAFSALSGMALSKSLSSDGLLAEFYLALCLRCPSCRGF